LLFQFLSRLIDYFSEDNLFDFVFFSFWWVLSRA